MCCNELRIFNKILNLLRLIFCLFLTEHMARCKGQALRCNYLPVTHSCTVIFLQWTNWQCLW